MADLHGVEDRKEAICSGNNMTRRRNAASDLVSACLQLLALRAVFAWRSNNVPVFDRQRQVYRSFNGLKGVSDILGVLADGRLLAVECKTGRGKLSPEQQAFLDAVNARGGLGVCVRSVQELEDVLGRQK